MLECNPWLKIWVKPRETISEIVSFNPKYRLGILSALYGFPLLLHMAQMLSLGSTVSVAFIAIVSVILAFFVGMIVFAIGSYLLLWTGKWIGGRGDFASIRAAFAWSNVGNVFNSAIWIVLMSYFGSSLFDPAFASRTFIGNEMTLVLSVFSVQLVVSIWCFVLFLKTLGEVQGFSAWKAFLNLIIASLLVVAASILFVWGLSWVFTGMYVVGQ